MAKDTFISIEWEGFEDVKRALDRWEEEAVQAAARGVDESGEDLLQKAQALAPKLKGDLEGSGTKDQVRVNALSKEISVEIGFNKTYAARRHEEDYNPGPITRGKPAVDGMMPGRKYIERPLQYYTPRYMQNIADAVRETTGDD